MKAWPINTITMLLTLSCLFSLIFAMTYCVSTTDNPAIWQASRSLIELYIELLLVLNGSLYFVNYKDILNILFWVRDFCSQFVHCRGNMFLFQFGLPFTSLLIIINKCSTCLNFCSPKCLSIIHLNISQYFTTYIFKQKHLLDHILQCCLCCIWK